MHLRAAAVPVVVPVYVPVAYEDAEPPQQKSEPESKVQVVIVERENLDAVVERKVKEQIEEKLGKKENTAGKLEPKPEPKQETMPEPELSTTLIVFRDGSKKELHNYAIMGANLFDLSDSLMRRIALDSIDVPATQKANEAAGKQFRLP